VYLDGSREVIRQGRPGRWRNRSGRPSPVP
jgi:hypothetical protein